MSSFWTLLRHCVESSFFCRLLTAVETGGGISVAVSFATGFGGVCTAIVVVFVRVCFGFLIRFEVGRTVVSGVEAGAADFTNGITGCLIDGLVAAANCS